MADPLSIVTSINRLISTGTKLSFTLGQFIAGLRSASSNVRGLLRELEELCVLLGKLKSSFSKGLRHEYLWQDLANVLDSCMERFVQIEVLLKGHTIGVKDRWLSKQWKRGKWWAFQEKEVIALKSQLEAHKATLNVTLLLSTHTEQTPTKATTDRIEAAVQEVADRLVRDRDVEETVARYPSGFILQTYLSSAASVFSSRPSTLLDIKRVTGIGMIDGGTNIDQEWRRAWREAKEERVRIEVASNNWLLEERRGRAKTERARIEAEKKLLEEKATAAKKWVEEERARILAESKKLLEERAAVEKVKKAVEDAGEAMVQAIIDQVTRKTNIERSKTERRAKRFLEKQPAVGQTKNTELHARIGQDNMTLGNMPYTKFPKGRLCKEALDERNIAYTEESDHFLVPRVVNMAEQNYLWIRTKELRRPKSTPLPKGY